MAIRSTTSEFQPIPPNYTTKAGIYRNIGRYQRINASVHQPARPNMSTAPVLSDHSQYVYIPRLNG